MDYAIQLAAALAGSLGFAALFNLRGRKLVFSSLGGFLSWTVYLLAGLFTESPYLCAFSASVIMTLYAERMARVHRTPVTVYLVIAAIPLIPGASLYHTAEYMMQGLSERAAAQGLHTLLFAASMSAGVTVTSLVVRMLLDAVRSRKNRLSSR